MGSDFYYSDEKNVQILISLLKQHGIKKVIASPGTTNIPFVGSIQSDPWFEIYSSIDERSAGYLACGMSAESDEPVVLTCTGATASRNYVSALTEAYYNKLPIIAITSTQTTNRIGHNIAQVIDRTVQMNDIVKMSVQIPAVKNEDDEWAVNVSINKAILESSRHGGGPVHINLTSSYSRNFNVKELAQTRIINRVFQNSKEWPNITAKKIGIFVGNHKKWKKELVDAVEIFCSKYNAVLICDQTSKFFGEHGVLGNLLLAQEKENLLKHFDLLIDIGNISGAYMYVDAKESWRINPDGEIRDPNKVLTNVFEMEEIEFFTHYINEMINSIQDVLIAQVKAEDEQLHSMIPELPFSNIWMAQQLAQHLPENSVLHLGILNSLRAWNFFPIKNHVECYSNTGGFGIDGNTSALIGASLVHPEKLYFGIIGDLAFFYDLNSLGNRCIGKNLRILLVNNGCGTEFKNYNHMAAIFGVNADEYMAAAGHFGNKSKDLVKHYANDLGFTYLSANNKEEFIENISVFIANESVKPIIFEVFVNSNNESDALFMMNHLSLDGKDHIGNKEDKESISNKVKQAVRSAIGDNRVEGIKMIIKG